MSSTPPQSPPSHKMRTPPPVPKPRQILRAGSQPSPTSATAATRTAVFSKYLMNDIPRGTTYSKLINSLLAPPLGPTSGQAEKPQPHVQCSLVMSNSRLDDELSVAKIEFSDTPEWLQTLGYDPNGFPKKTTFGTLWRFSDVSARDADGKTEFIRAVTNGKEHMDLFYPEMLAEFDDVDVNIQDARGRTALHWACEAKLENMVRLCLSVPDCDVGLKDNEGLTAFDISLRSGQEVIPGLFYNSMFNLEQSHPQAALLRVLTFTDSVGDRPVFPGEALFDPIEDRNMPLVTALLNRCVDLTSRNKDGNTALHVAASQVGSADIARMLLEAGADINAIGKGGTTPMQHAAATRDEEMMEVFTHWVSNGTARDPDGGTVLQSAAQGCNLGSTGMIDHGQAPGPATETQVDRPIPQRAMADNTEPTDKLQFIKQLMVTLLGDKGLSDQAGRDALHKVVLAGDLDSTEALLELGVSTQSRYPGQSVLQVAAESGHDLVVQRLLAAGADVEAMHGGLYSTLGTAAKYGHDPVVRVLLAAGANVEALSSTGSSAIMIAAENGHNHVVQTLLAAGANVEAQGSDGCRALGIAARYGHDPVVQTLLAAGANVEAPVLNGVRAITIATENGHQLTVQTLLAAGANVEAEGKRGYTTLGVAARNGHNPIVQMLLAAGANVEAEGSNGCRALGIAARNGHDPVVQTLLAAGANVDAPALRGVRALVAASEKGHNHVVLTLLAAGANLEDEGCGALVLAAGFGHDPVVQTLLAAGANVDATAFHGVRALIAASEKGHTLVVQTLLAAGANTEGGEGQSSTALIEAARNGHDGVIKTLLAAGADIDAKFEGKSSLQVASGRGHKQTVQILLDAGALTRAARVRRDMRRQIGL